MVESWVREASAFVKMLSIIVADVDVILVGLFINGKQEWENKQFMKSAVGA